MKTIIRRAALHGSYKYRTTDADGGQTLWMRRPKYFPPSAMALGRWGSVGYIPWDSAGFAQPPRTPHLAIVKIGPQK